jgi:hypothetical protein
LLRRAYLSGGCGLKTTTNLFHSYYRHQEGRVILALPFYTGFYGVVLQPFNSETYVVAVKAEK